MMMMMMIPFMNLSRYLTD